MIEPQSFDDNIIYLIGEVSRLAHKRVTSIFQENHFDITVEQFGILAVLWYEEGVNQQTLADTLNRDKTTITRIVQNMVKKNLVVKVPDQLDKRNNLIYLTQKGSSLQKEMINSTAVVYTDALKTVTSDQIKILTSTLKKMTNNLKEHKS